MRKISVLLVITAITVLLVSVLIVFPLAGHSQSASSTDLRRLVIGEMSEYILNDTVDRIVYKTEMVIIVHQLIQYDIPGKGTVKMGDSCFAIPLDNFIAELSNKTDPVGYIRQLKEELKNPAPEPDATFGGGDPWDTKDFTCSGHEVYIANYTYAVNVLASVAESVGLTNNDEAQHVILELRVINSSQLVDHWVWERVFHFEQTDGAPGNSLSITGVGRVFQMRVQNDESGSQQFRIYRSIQGIAS